MAFVTSSSRFALLNDDVQDPFDQKKKQKKPNTTTTNKNTQSNGNSGTNKGNSKPGSNNQSKKPKPSSTNGASSAGTKPKPKSTVNTDADAAGGDAAKKKKLSKQNEKALNLPIRMDPDWERRDEEFVDGTYEKELEEALVQSRVDFEVKQKHALDECRKLAKTSKKKPKPVSLAEFNMLLNQPVKTLKEPDDLDFLTEQFRKDAKIELDKQRQREKEKSILVARSSKVNGNALVQEEPASVFDDKDILIQQLSSRNEDLEQEVYQLKAKLKKAGELLTNAELKDKAMLLKDLEMLSKVNEDMNEELRGVYSQLEQERSKSHATAIELRKLHEQTRRRTQSHTESQ